MYAVYRVPFFTHCGEFSQQWDDPLGRFDPAGRDAA